MVLAPVLNPGAPNAPTVPSVVPIFWVFPNNEVCPAPTASDNEDQR